MTTDQVRAVLATMAGYWPTPAMTEEEVIAYTVELTGPARITAVEAGRVIKAESGRQWRPRAGEFVGLVQHYRRADALRNPRPAIGRGAYCTPEQNLAHLRRCRELLVTPPTATPTDQQYDFSGDPF